jgi:MFS family permease
MSEDYPHYRRNFASFAGDWVCFVIAMAFISYTTVIPSFINQLTDFAPLIGLVTTIANGAWLLPQLVAANYVASKERKKPFVITLALIGRPMYLLVVAVILLTGDTYPWLLLIIFFVAETIFSATDGLSMVAWFDILSRTIPPERRGRFYSTPQILGGLLAMVAGFGVKQILGPQGPTFPHNYGLLFLLCVAFLFLSLVFLGSLKEPSQQVQTDREPWRVYMPRVITLLRRDKQFRLLNVVRLLAALGGLALPFYVIYATDVLQLSDESIGLFVSAQVLGGIAASLAMGYLNERSGSKVVTQVTVALGLSTPLLALLICYCSPQGGMVTYIYAMVFFLIGANYAGYMQGFMNLVLDMSPPDQRPTYIGLYNTLGGALIMVAPLLGGLLLQSTSHPILFAAAAIGPAMSLILSFRLVEPRRSQCSPGQTNGGGTADDIE